MSSPSSDPSCLDEGALLGWVEGTLDPEVRALAQAHVVDCEACFSAIAEVHAVSASATPAVQGRRYTLGVELGRGGMGVVYRGRDELLSREVAIKVLQGDWGARAHRERLLEESTAMARLRHPNVVAVHDVVVEDGQAFVVMELVEGQTLRLWFESAQPSPSEVLAMFEQIGRGLEAAHEAGVVHRDFKPENVLVGAGSRPQIVDFGIASTQGPHEPSTITESTTGGESESQGGTPGYMAPEQREGGSVDARADQYAFCVSLWEMLFGARPTEHSGAPTKHGLSRVRRVLEQGLQVCPDARHAGMGPLLAALERAQRSRWPWIAAAVGAVLVTGSAVAVLSAPPSEYAACLSLAGAIRSKPSESDLSAIAKGLRKRDGLRGELLGQEAQKKISSMQSALSQAAADACEVENSPERERALSCLFDVDAKLEFIVETSAGGDLELLHEIQFLRNIPLCSALGTERRDDALPGFWERWVETQIRTSTAQAEVLARVGRPSGADAADIVLKHAASVGHAELQARAHAARGGALWFVEPQQARESFKTAVALAQRNDDRFEEGLMWTRFGLFSEGWEVETQEHSLAQARRAQSELSAKALRDALAPRIAVLSSLAAFHGGRPEAARAQLRDAQGLMRSQAEQVSMFAELQVLLAWLDGDLEKALGAQRLSVQWKQSNGLTSSAELAYAHAVVAESELDLDRVDDAAISASRALALVDEARSPLEERQFVDSVAARVASEQGHFQEAASRLAPHLATLEDAAAGAAAWEVLIAKGKALSVEGRFDEAVETLVRARRLSGLDAPEAIGEAIEVVVPIAIAMRRAGRGAEARTLLTPLEAWHREKYPKLGSTGQATMTLAWLDLDDGDRESAKARFSAAREFLARPLDQAWAEFGGTVASVGANGQASLEERALAERALDRFSARAPSHRFEVDAIERWLASHEPSEVTAPDRLDLQDPVRGTPRHDARP